MVPTAKRFVLQLLSAADGHELTAAKLVAAGDVLAMTGNRVRVAIARLVAAGTLEATGRGSYRLGEAAQAITRHATGWRELERQVRRWDGGWAFVHVGELARSDRGALVRRERALRLLGFRTLGRTLEVRPDNLQGGVPELRARLVELGVEPEALVVRASELDAATDARARKLWERERLSASYVQTTQRIDRWLATPDAEPRAAAREAFLFGGEVLRKIIFDPRLPEPLVDVAARRAMVEAARRLDAHGRRLWARLAGVAVAMTEEGVRAAA
ncbi:MAG: PaaX family transcriptional regulator C-terminal domain-containing protein [Acidobacteriota bacterium]